MSQEHIQPQTFGRLSIERAVISRIVQKVPAGIKVFVLALNYIPDIDELCAKQLSALSDGVRCLIEKLLAKILKML